MKISKRGLEFIAGFEGLRLKPYLCPAGIPTIGYGHTNGVRMTDPPITKDEALEFLEEDCDRFMKTVNKAVTVPLSQNQFDALVSFSFNVGSGAFRKSTLLKKLNRGEYENAADELLRWNKAGGRVLDGLTRRRKAERSMFLEAAEVQA